MTQSNRAVLQAIEYHLPEARVTNDALAEQFPEWTPARIHEIVGVDERHVAASDECASDLAVAAATKLFASGRASPADIDYVIHCTQAPDYFLPTTACVIQNRLGLPRHCGAVDINLGCSGYVYGLGLAKGLIESEQANRVLFLTADTYSKYLNPRDKSVRSVLADGAAATLLTSDASATGGWLAGPFVYGTDGRGASNLIVPAGGMRQAYDPNAPVQIDDSGNERTANNVYMNGAEIFAFTLREVPAVISRVLSAKGLSVDDVDLFVPHQANAFILAHLQRKLRIPPERFVIDMADCGNTGSSTIAIALRRAMARGAIRAGMRVMLVGFGVGYSWGATLLEWI